MEKLSKNKLKYLRKFLKKKIRRQENKCLVEGEKMCLEALENGFHIDMLIYEKGLGRKFRDVTVHKNVLNVFSCDNAAIRSLSEVETPQGIVGLVNFHTVEQEPGNNKDHKFYIALDNISDPGNTGTILRTASWFGWDGILCGLSCVEVTSGKVLRSSMGAAFHLNIWEDLDLAETLKKLKEDGFIIAGSVPEGGEKKITTTGKKTVLAVGNEASGLSQEILDICDEVFTIEGYGKAESLNAAVSAAIIMERLTTGY
ncbi:TrmH family RNA methyltransferase [candidate division KSB1 bacterium]